MKFGYPLRQCVEALLPICDEVVLAYDPTTEDGTRELARQLRDELGIVLYESIWDMSNMDRGFEIGHQSQVAVDACSPDTEWRLCVQQDEAFHEDDAGKIKELVLNASNGGVDGFQFLRPYFFGNLHTIRRDWSVEIIRLTRKGAPLTYDGFDGQNCVPTAPCNIAKGGVWMYHYSRIGDPAIIAKRVRNVDTFFHAEDNLPAESDLTPYDFTTKEYDSYAFTENPQETDSALVNYQGTHPLPYAELYQDYE